MASAPTTDAPAGTSLVPPVPASPVEWLRTHVSEQPGTTAGDGRPSGDLISFAELDAPRLAGIHAVHTAAGATRQAATKWLCGWFAGGVAERVGYTLACASAALLVEPAAVRWRMHPDHWPEHVDVGTPEVAVAPDHPWAAEPGVRVLATQRAVREAAIASVVAVATPLVARCRTVGRVGARALWAEVADGFGLALVHRPELPVHGAAVAELRAALGLPGVPWRVRPSPSVGRTSSGPAYLGQKGGCCLAYQCAEPGIEAAPADAAEPVQDDGHTAYLLAYRARFPQAADAPDYCSTCSLRSADDSADRQRFWVEFHRGGAQPASD